MKINLDQIVRSSPFQTRKENVADIEALAESIEAIGLQSPPKVRVIKEQTGKGTFYEIVYGHNRIAAVHSLGWKEVECIVEDLTDEQAGLITITENASRTDLTPLETARLMSIARAKYDIGKTAEIFHVTNQTVLAYLRILDLPLKIQNLIHDGTISKTAVPGMVAYVRIMGEKSTLDAIGEVTKHQGDVGSHRLIDKMKGRLQWDSHGQFGELESSYGSSRTDFPSDKSFSLKPTLVPKKVKLTEYAGITKEQEPGYDELVRNLSGGIDMLAQPWLSDTLSQRQVEMISVSLFPPACDVCPFRVVLLGYAYCSMKPCLIRKKRSWSWLKFQEYVKKSGVPVYSEAKDGVGLKVDKTIDDPKTSKDETHLKYVKLIKEGKFNNLRVREAHSQYGLHAGTGHEYAQLVDITPAAIKKAVKAKEERAEQQERNDYNSPAKQEERRLQEVQVAIYKKFIHEKVTDLFLPAMKVSLPELITFGRLDDRDVQRDFGKSIVINDNNRLELYRRCKVIESFNTYQAQEGCKLAVDKIIKPFAIALGVEIPAGFDETLDAFILENSGVPAEIEEEEEE